MKDILSTLFYHLSDHSSTKVHFGPLPKTRDEAILKRLREVAKLRREPLELRLSKVIHRKVSCTKYAFSYRLRIQPKKTSLKRYLHPQKNT